MDKRTNVDFSEHIVIETHFKNDNHNIDIWDLKLPDSDYIHRVTFINSCDRMMVKGDFGNWVFSREFHPSKNGGVNSYYWDEKLKTSEEWKLEHDYIIVYDPDGWDRKNYHYSWYEELITEKEFMNRVHMSTCIIQFKK